MQRKNDNVPKKSEEFAGSYFNSQYQVVKFFVTYELIHNTVRQNENWKRKTGKKALVALKFVEAILSKINPTSISFEDLRQMPHEQVLKLTTYQFTKSEYLELLGMNSNNVKDAMLSEMVQTLTSIKVTFEDLTTGKIKSVDLFPVAQYEPAKKLFTVVINSNDEQAFDMFYHVKNNHYFMYRLQNIIYLTSYNAYMLYQGLLRWHQGNGKIKKYEFSIGLEECMDMMDYRPASKDGRTYTRFRDRTLQSSVDEINRKTDMHVEYEKGRRVQNKVVEIIFRVEPKLCYEARMLFEQRGIPYQAPDRMRVEADIRTYSHTLYLDHMKLVMDQQTDMTAFDWDYFHQVMDACGHYVLDPNVVLNQEQKDVLEEYYQEFAARRSGQYAFSLGDTRRILRMLERYGRIYMLQALAEAAAYEKVTLDYADSIMGAWKLRGLTEQDVDHGIR